MKSKLGRGLLATAFALMVGVPSVMASDTDITINATIDEIVSLQIETSAGVIVSGDYIDPQAGSPASVEVLEFGTVDPMGLNVGGTGGGAYSSLNQGISAGSGTLARNLYEDDTDLRDTSDGFAAAPDVADDADGALYYVAGGYQLRAIRNDGDTDMDVDVQVVDGAGGGNALDAWVFANGSTTYATSGTPSTYTATGRRAVASTTDLVDAMALNTPYILDLGIFVPFNRGAGATSTRIIFWGT